MKWLKQIFETYNKGLEYDELEEDSQREIDSLGEALYDSNQQYLEVVNKYDLLKEEMNKLLNKDKINVQDLKEWYEGKYDNTPWLYNYDGKGRKDSKFALKVTKAGEVKLKQFAAELIYKYKMMIGETTSTEVVEKVMKHFLLRGQWTYIKDGEQFGKNEYWELAENSLETRKGDCDDLAILMHNIIYYVFDSLSLQHHYWRLKLTAGLTIKEGHAFNIWLHDDGEWYVVESTMDLAGTLKKTWLKTPIKNNNFYISYYGFVRKDRSWIGLQSSLESYKDK